MVLMNEMVLMIEMELLIEVKLKNEGGTGSMPALSLLIVW